MPPFAAKVKHMKGLKKGTIDGFLAERSSENIRKQVALECLEADLLTMGEYLDIIEEIQDDEEKRKAAFRRIAELLWQKGAPADVYESWLNICIKEGVF